MGATLDARTFRDAMSRYVEALDTHRQEIDSLNVFPVPDGDTGTNMLLTQRTVSEAVAGVDGAPFGRVGETAARAALMGARGNSGVILSQVLRGLCTRLCRGEAAEAEDLAEALGAAHEEARRAVAEPVEGTMLSVLRDAAAEALEACRGGAPLGDVAAAALEASERSLARTRDQLPALAEAGVVDAGGKGIVLLLDALVSAIREVPLSVPVGPGGPVGVRDEAGPGQAEGRFGFEVMYLLECSDGAVGPLRERLGGLGDSLVVVGGGGLFTVHVHTDEPGAAVEAGIDAGRPRDVRISSLDEQVARACMAGEARAVRAPANGAPTAACGLVAVAAGEGIAALFRSLGASVINGGPGRNPSVGELATAVREAGGEEVILLPNHPNVVPAAERAGARVAPTRSVPEGLAAATAFDPGAPLDDNLARMREAAERVITAEVASASRDADTPAGPVRAGQVMGMTGGEIRAVGDDPVDVAVGVLQPLVGPDHEVLTAVTGEDLEDPESVRRTLQEAFPRLEVEVHPGGQPHYPLLAGLE